MRFLICAILAFFVSGIAFSNPTDESILNYDVVMKLQNDSSLFVSEKITVNALHRQIINGIFLDIPTRFRNSFSKLQETPLLIKEVTRNGQKIDFSTVSQYDGMRIYLGNHKTPISKGVHQYKITYQLLNVATMSEKYPYDVLSYNVIGRDWRFKIENVSIQIELPQKALMHDFKVFNQPNQNTLMNVQAKGQTIYLTSQRPLNEKEGVDIYVEMEKGAFIPLDFWQQQKVILTGKIQQFFYKNLWQINGFLILLFSLIIYFYISWTRFGREEISQAVYPRWDEIKDVSLTLVSRIFNLALPSGLLALHFYALEKKGLLSIQQEGTTLILQKQKEYSGFLSPEEQLFMTYAKDSYILHKKTDLELEDYSQKLKSFLDKEYKKLVEENRFLQQMFLVLSGICLFIGWIFLGFFELPSLFLVFMLHTLLLRAGSHLFFFRNWVKALAFISFGAFFSFFVYGISQSVFCLIWFYIIEILNICYVFAIMKLSPKMVRLKAHYQGIKLFFDRMEQPDYQQLLSQNALSMIPYLLIYDQGLGLLMNKLSQQINKGLYQELDNGYSALMHLDKMIDRHLFHPKNSNGSHHSHGSSSHSHSHSHSHGGGGF